MIITSDSNLWSCGANEYGQLCFKNNHSKITTPQKTSFSNISKISAGNFYSLFQNIKGEIFACGYNYYGQCGLGHFNHPQFTILPSVAAIKAHDPPSKPLSSGEHPLSNNHFNVSK